MVNMAAEGHSLYGAASSTVLLPVLTGTPVAGRLLGATPKGAYVAFDNATIPTGIRPLMPLRPPAPVRLPLAMLAPVVLPVGGKIDPSVPADAVPPSEPNSGSPCAGSIPG